MHGTLWGMPKPFRMVSCSEQVRMEWTGYSVGSLRRENAEPNVSGFVWLDLSSFHGLQTDFVDLGHRIWLDLSGSVWI